MRVYIAAPYTLGDVAVNVRNAIMAADRLVELGHQPYVPHLTHFWHLVSPKPYEFWLELDMTFLNHWAEALLRLPGKSSGADGEVERAKKIMIPVYYSIDEFRTADKSGKEIIFEGGKE